MTPYEAWAARHPQAAAELAAIESQVHTAPPPPAGDGHSEAWAQQQARFSAAQQGVVLYRNNVGATPARCPDCLAQRQPVRYGLCNDTHALNQKFKSGDLIGLRPVLITAEHIGQTIAQFTSFEVKRPGWRYTGTKQEPAQKAWRDHINRLGGLADFTQGVIEL